MNTIEGDNPSFLQTNIQFATFQPLAQHVSITRNQYTNHCDSTNNKKPQQVKQDMLLVSKAIHG
jgi:hypothetical protein